MRVGVGGLLTPDGCIGVWRYLEWSPATYRLRSLAFTSPGSGIVLGWAGVLVSSVWTVWWQVCAHGGGMGCSEASAERNPLLG